MPVENEVFAANARRLLDEVFNEDPVNPADPMPQFVISGSWELRRSLLPETHALSYVPVFNLDLPLRFLQTPSLGPYERSALADLLAVEHGVVVLRGGTGSGKTSLLNHLHSVVQLACRGQWENEHKTLSFMVLVDLQPLSPVFKLEQQRDEARKVQFTEFLKEVAQEARAALCRILPGRANDALKLVAAALKRKQHSGSMNKWESLLDRLRDKYPDGPTGDWEAIFDALEPEDAFLASLLPFVELGTQYAERADASGNVEEHGVGGYLVIFDNIDPLPNSLQMDFYRLLAGHAGSSAWRGSRFAVVVSMRLTSAIEPVGALPFVEIRTHQCPDPAEIVVFRLTQFLLEPTQFRSFVRLQKEFRIQVHRRLALFWVRLLDPVGGFGDLLSGISGTNIRNAFLHAKAWCLSPQIRDQGWGETRVAEFTKILPSVVAEHSLRELGGAVGRGARILMEGSANGHESHLDSALLAGVASKLKEMICHVVMSSGMGTGAEESKTGPRGFVVKRIRKRLLEYVRDRVKRAPPPGTMLQKELVAIRSWNTQRWHFVTRLANRLKEVPDPPEKLSDVERAVYQFLRGRLIYALIECTANGRKVTPLATSEALEVSRSRVSLLTALAGSRKPNRYQSARLLLDAQCPGQTLDIKAVNVFSVHDVTICPVSLRVLYLLAEAPSQKMKYQLLKDKLLLHGYSPEDIKTVLAEMVGIGKRMIYSFVNDYFAGITRWDDEPATPVFLSWAGKSYWDTVIVHPVYIQWAFARTRDVQASIAVMQQFEDGIHSRLRAALEGFRMLVGDEEGRLQAAWERLKGSEAERQERLVAEQLTIQNAATDVFFRAIGSFVETLCHRSLGVTDESLAVARDWVAFGRRSYDRNRQLFGTSPMGWEVSLAHAEHLIETSINRTRFGGRGS